MTASGSPKPPNVLWICTDQQRWDTIAALGNRHINTPNIDRLVAQGTACTNAYCQSPICTPSRASFLSGCYEHRARLQQRQRILGRGGAAGDGTAGGRRLHRVPLEPRSA